MPAAVSEAALEPEQPGAGRGEREHDQQGHGQPERPPGGRGQHEHHHGDGTPYQRHRTARP